MTVMRKFIIWIILLAMLGSLIEFFGARKQARVAVEQLQSGKELADQTQPSMDPAVESKSRAERQRQAAERAWAERRAAAEARDKRITSATEIDPIIEAYEKNEIAADLTYKHRQITFRGKIARLAKDVLGGAYITLQSPGYRTIECSFGREWERSQGDEVVVTGTCDGLMVNVQMSNCKVETINGDLTIYE